ncbi:MAG: rhomboid family intramembrane serine protease [Sedimentisphaerales bacterium]|nr:rhomboid family intramembrane serine protease [Sedimentisphaerales bacterium]
MIIPLRVDVPQERWPVANWLLIGIIIAFFVWQFHQVNTYHTSIEEELNTTVTQENYSTVSIDLFKGLVLTGWTIRGLLGYMWLHGGYIHLIGNLLFLWIFGNAVCAKIGQIPFIVIYIILGVAAGALHLLLVGTPAIGASGAINGVIGMYLIFFPTNSIECLFVLLFPGIYVRTFEVSSYAIILLWFIYDILGAVIGGGNIAYFAHIGGFLSGVMIAVILLKLKIITMARYEKSLLQVFTRSPEPESKRPLYEQLLTREYSASYEEPKADYAAGTWDQIQEPDAQINSSAKSLTDDGFIHFYCSCGKTGRVPAKFAGKTGKCPYCHQLIKIPFA